MAETKTYSVSLTAVYVGYAEVEAESPADAKRKIEQKIANGEPTAAEMCFSAFQSVDEGEELDEIQGIIR